MLLLFIINSSLTTFILSSISLSPPPRLFLWSCLDLGSRQRAMGIGVCHHHGNTPEFTEFPKLKQEVDTWPSLPGAALTVDGWMIAEPRWLTAVLPFVVNAVQ